MKIIYEDTEKLIVEKPAGVLTQSARSFDTDLVKAVSGAAVKGNAAKYTE